MVPAAILFFDSEFLFWEQAIIKIDSHANSTSLTGEGITFNFFLSLFIFIKKGLLIDFFSKQRFIHSNKIFEAFVQTIPLNIEDFMFQNFKQKVIQL